MPSLQKPIIKNSETINGTEGPGRGFAPSEACMRIVQAESIIFAKTIHRENSTNLCYDFLETQSIEKSNKYIL